MADDQPLLSDNGVVAVVGAGLSGALCALHLLRARPGLTVRLIDVAPRFGPGLAYGAAAEAHQLNVPVSRLQIWEEDTFQDWLGRKAGNTGHLLRDALAESGGQLGDAFVPRILFGAFLEDQLAALRDQERPGALEFVRGEAVAFLDAPQRGVLLKDGRQIEADAVILALGNLPPKPPGRDNAALYNSASFINDPWGAGVLDAVGPDEDVVLIGAGLTMVDVAIRLDEAGHRGRLRAFSRNGLLPTRHAFGGHWPPLVVSQLLASPSRVMRVVRAELRRAIESGAPWQRVVDALRPMVARIWQNWTITERRRFLRHLRPRWDVIRHRMAPRVADRVEALIASGRLSLRAARLTGCRQSRDGLELDLRNRSGEAETLRAQWVINCTGPRTDFDTMGEPLVVDARRRGWLRADSLGLGLETSNCAVVDGHGRSSTWLFAVGPLTRSAWWEITAAPEINAQIRQFAQALGAPGSDGASLADRFLDLGAGI